MRTIILFALAVLATGCATVHKNPDGSTTYGATQAPGHVVHQEAVNLDDMLRARSENPNAPMSVRIETSNNRGTTRVDMSTGYGFGMLGGTLPTLDPCARIDPFTGISPCALESDVMFRQPGYPNRPLPTLVGGQQPAEVDVTTLQQDVRALQEYVRTTQSGGNK